MNSCRRYVEFGTGGSTIIACTTVGESVVSVDSSRHWQDDVMRRLAERRAPITPTFQYVDIGPVAAWGWPTDDSRRGDWPAYYTTLWSLDGACEADLYFIDGRFRVACFMETLLRSRTDATIVVHDYARSEYQIMGEVAQEIARARTLVAFRKPPDFDEDRVREILAEFRFDPR